MEALLKQRCIDYLSEVIQLGRLRVRNVRDVNDNSVIDLTTNDYLGLANSERVKQAMICALEKYGSSASGLPVVNGYLRLHQEFETHLCDWLGFEEAILWSSGFQANESINEQPGETR